MAKKCKWCQKDIDSKVKICRHCGKDVRNLLERNFVIVSILALVILGLAGILAKNYIESSSSDQEQLEQPTSTSVRHDNSGTGAIQEDNSSENHVQRIMDHLGL